MKNNKIIKKKTKRILIIILLNLIFILIFSEFPMTASSNKEIISVENQKTFELQFQDGWNIQESGTTQTLWGVSFTDTNTGTAVGESTTILRTIDGGEIWSEQDCSLSVDFLDVSFSDENNGVACGTLGTIIYTTNAGNTWITYQTDWMMQYYGAHMETSLIGVLVGENSIFSPLVTWTLDGWQTHNSKGFLINNNEGELWDVHYGSSTTWYAAARVWTNEGAIVRTIDGGSNWDTIYWADRGFYGMDFPSTNIGYTVGVNGIIIKTIDGGNTWNQLSSGVDTTLLDVSFATDNCGTAVGKDGLIIRTEDGGNTWSSQESGTSFDLRAVQFIDSDNGFVVGENGIILHTTTGGYSGDIEPPITTCSLDGTMNGSIYTSDVTVTLTAIDTDSGVNYTMYKLDSGTWITYSKSFLVSNAGQHILYFYSVDIAGNIETENNCTFNIQHPPNIPIISGSTHFKPDQNKEFTFTTTDSDGDQIYYYVDWGDENIIDWQGPYSSGTAYKASHSWSEKKGYTIKCKAKDINNIESDYGTLDISTSRVKMLNSNFLIILQNHQNLFSFLHKLMNSLMQ